MRVTFTKPFTTDDRFMPFAKVNNAHHPLLLTRSSSYTSLCNFQGRLTLTALFLQLHRSLISCYNFAEYLLTFKLIELLLHR